MPAHLVLDLIRSRLASGSRPLHRDDGARLAVVLEGGSSRAAYAGGMVCELEERGILQAVDAVHGSSAGALNGAWLVCGRARANVRGWWEPESMRAIIRPGNALRRLPVVDGDTLIDHVYETVTPLGFEDVLASDVEYHPTGTDIETGECTDLAPFIRDRATLGLALKATSRLPVLSGPPVELGGRSFIDGGLADNVPVRHALAQGATHVLVLRTRVPSLELRRTHPARRLTVGRWLARHAVGASEAWRTRNEVARDVERLMASDARVLQVHPPVGAPRISVVGSSVAVQKQAVQIGRAAMVAALDAG